MSSLALFAGSVPANYDKYLGPILFEPYALDIVERLRKNNVERLLELACGTGRVTRHLADLLSDSGSMVAIDLNPGMLQVAKEKIQSNKIEWKVANALELPFENNSFDHVVCQFGVMFFPDKEKSFREVNRVLKAGGQYIFNTWENVENNPRIDLMWKVMNEIFGEGTPDFLQKGPHSFYDKNEIELLLQNAGFKTVCIETVAKTPTYNEPDDLVKGFTDGSPLNNYLKDKDERIKVRFRERLRQALTEQDQILGNTVPSLALVTEAIK